MIGRKAQIEDFGEMLLASVIIILLAVMMVFFINNQAQAKQNAFDEEIARIDASYTTRMMLQHEIEPGKKLYEEIIELVNSNPRRRDYDALFEKIEVLFNDHYASSQSSDCFFKIGDDNRYSSVPGATAMLSQRVKTYPHVVVPNPEGQNINVLLFELKPIHYKRIDIMRSLTRLE